MNLGKTATDIEAVDIGQGRVAARRDRHQSGAGGLEGFEIFRIVEAERLVGEVTDGDPRPTGQNLADLERDLGGGRREAFDEIEIDMLGDGSGGSCDGLVAARVFHRRHETEMAIRQRILAAKTRDGADDGHDRWPSRSPRESPAPGGRFRRG